MALQPAPATAQTPVNITPPNLGGALAGSAPGSESVSPSGGATYTVPIPLPPGTAGIIPAMSLQYSSQSGTSLLGHGWSLGGLTSIMRCPKTLVHDGVRRGIALDAQDPYCLGGRRLLLVSGTHGATAEYRSEVDDFSRIRPYGSSPAKGPDSWEVRTKAGLIHTFGQTANATIEAQGKATVLAWALSRTRDRRGNYYDVKYIEQNDAVYGEFRPQGIVYTGNLVSGLVPYNAVDFIYTARPDLSLGFVACSRVTQSQRLSAVQARLNIGADGSGGTLARELRIAYVTNATSGRSLVSSVSDCDAAGTCLPATRFTSCPYTHLPTA